MNPLLVLMMIGSNSRRIAGSANTTVTILISAPLAISMQSEEITEIPEYIPTPKVAAKKDIALTKMLWIEVLWAIRTASFLLFPALLSTWYLLVIRIA